jgi:hypothetical protein
MALPFLMNSRREAAGLLSAGVGVSACMSNSLLMKKSGAQSKTAPISVPALSRREMDAVVRVWEDCRNPGRHWPVSLCPLLSRLCASTGLGPHRPVEMLDFHGEIVPRALRGA